MVATCVNGLNKCECDAIYFLPVITRVTPQVQHCVPNQWQLDCFFQQLTTKKSSNLRILTLCEGDSPVTGGFPSQRAGNAESSSTTWCHHIHAIFYSFQLSSMGVFTVALSSAARRHLTHTCPTTAPRNPQRSPPKMPSNLMVGIAKFYQYICYHVMFPGRKDILYTDGLVQDSNISSVFAMEIPQSRTKPSIWCGLFLSEDIGYSCVSLFNDTEWEVTDVIAHLSLSFEEFITPALKKSQIGGLM